MRIKTTLSTIISAMLLTSSSVYAIEKDSLKGLKVIDESLQEQACSCLIMSENLEGSEDAHKLRAYLSLLNKDTKNAVEVNPFISGRKLCLSGLEFGTNYLLTVKKGLKAGNSISVSNDFSMDFKTIDSKPVISFNRGLVLSKAVSDKKISVETVNVDSFKISMFRLSAKSIDSGSMYSHLEENISHYDLISLVNNSCQFVKSLIIRTDSKKNVKKENILSLDSFRENISEGMYLFVITKDDGRTDFQSSYDLLGDYGSLNIAKIVTISDLGVTTYKSDDSIDVAVRSIQTASPVAGAKVKLYSVSNELLSSAHTDSNGYARFDKKIIQGQNGMAPKMVVVQNVDDYYNVALDGSGLYLEDKFVQNDYEYLKTNKKIFAYTNRTLLRPGEKLYLNALIRNQDLSASSLQALKITVKRPNYSNFQEVTLKPSGKGSFEYEMTVPNDNSVGTWQIDLGYGKVVSFDVQSFVPDAFEVKQEKPESVVTSQDKIPVKVAYNYGSPAKNVQVRAKFEFRPDTHPVASLSDYSFGNDSESEDLIENVTCTQSTDSEGIVYFTPDSAVKPYPQKFTLTTELSSSESNAKGYSLGEYKLSFNNLMLGIRKGKVDEEGSTFDVVYANQDGDTFKTDANFSVYKKNITYQFARTNGRWEYIKNEYLSPITSGTVQTEDNGSGSITLPLEDGMYTIVLQNEKTKTSFSFYQGNRLNYEENTPDRFTLLTDKDEYQIGDTAVLSFESEYDGFADLVVGERGVKSITHHTVKKGHNKIKLPVTGDFNFGSYVMLTTYAAQSGNIKNSLRSIGLNYIKVDSSPVKLDISSNAADTIKPNSVFDVEVDVKNDGEDAYATAFLIDNGILNVSHQSAPDPVLELTKRRSFRTDIFDIYEYVMSDISTQGQGYGDESRAALGAQALSNILNVMFSKYQKTVQVKDGKAKFSFDVPNISGSAKLMVVAWSDSKLGSYSKDVNIVDNTAVSLSAPFYLHSHDSADAVISINNESTQDKEYTYSLVCRKPLKCDSIEKKTLIKGKEQFKDTVKIEASDSEEGMASLSVRADDYSYNQNFEIKVMSASDPVLESKIVHLDPHENKLVALDTKFRSDADVNIQVGSIPLTDISQLIKKAKSSSEFNLYAKASNLNTLIYALKSMNDVNSNEYKEISSIISDKVESLSGSFINRGSLNYDDTEYSENGYATAYAVKALIEAFKLGFNVDKQMLNRSLEYLSTLIADDNECTAALSMYVLASMGENVQSNLTYRFDHNSIVPVSALADYANTFALYGDTARQDEALKRAGRSLDQLLALNSKLDKTHDKENIYKLRQKLNAYQPFMLNSIDFEVLSLIKASLNSVNSVDIAALFKNLDRYTVNRNFFNEDCAAILAELYFRYGSDSTMTKGRLKDNRVKVENTKENAAIATISALGYVSDESDLTGSNQGIHISERYFTENGVELRTPVKLNLNEKVIVLYTIESDRALNATMYLKTKIPSNLSFIHEIDGQEAEHSYPFISKTDDYAKTVILDESITKQFNLYNSSFVQAAYLLKANFTGHSSALMSTVLVKNALTIDEKYLNRSHCVDVVSENKTADNGKKAEVKE